MQNPKILALICLGLAACALIANHAVARIPLAVPHLLPIETLPRAIGDWKMQSEREVDPEVRKILSTAKMIDRDYANGAGQTVNCLLLSAGDYKDFHDPNICFPGQGYNLTEHTRVTIAGQPFFMMRAARGGDSLRVLYSMPGDYNAGVPAGSTLKKMMALNKLFTRQEAQSFFVRMIVSDDQSGIEAEKKFAEDIMPVLRQMMAAAPPSTSL